MYIYSNGLGLRDVVWLLLDGFEFAVNPVEGWLICMRGEIGLGRWVVTH